MNSRYCRGLTERDPLDLDAEGDVFAEAAPAILNLLGLCPECGGDLPCRSCGRDDEGAPTLRSPYRQDDHTAMQATLAADARHRHSRIPKTEDQS